MSTEQRVERLEQQVQSHSKSLDNGLKWRMGQMEKWAGKVDERLSNIESTMLTRADFWKMVLGIAAVVGALGGVAGVLVAFI